MNPIKANLKHLYQNRKMLLFVGVILMAPTILMLVPADLFRMFISIKDSKELFMLGVYVYFPTFFFLGSCFSFFHLTVKRLSPFCLPGEDDVLSGVLLSEAMICSTLVSLPTDLCFLGKKFLVR